MKNYEFVTMIQNTGDINYVSDRINSREVFLTLINGFLYVQPGENTTKFYKEFRECLENSRAAGEIMYVRGGKHIPFNKCIRTVATMALMNCIKEHFDEEYFDSMLDKIDINFVSSTTKNFHHKLNLNQSQELSNLLRSIKSLDNTFNGVTSNDNFARLMAKVIYYTDINTAYVYANMLLDLDRALSMNVFNPSNIEISVGSDRVAS